jgi:hypothetical protein
VNSRLNLQGNGIVRFTRLQIQRQLSALLPKRINRLRVVQGGLTSVALPFGPASTRVTTA